MRETAILEIGQIPVADHWDKSLLEIAGEPVLQIFEKTGLNNVDSVFFGNMLSGAVNNQLQYENEMQIMASDAIGIHGHFICT